MSPLLILKSMMIARILRKSQNQEKKKSMKSSTVQKINSRMCRVCSKEMGIIPIFQNHKQPDIPKEIENFSGVAINEKDKLPKHLCQKCLDLLNVCITFRDMCQRTNKQMIELLFKKETESSSCEATARPESDESYNIPSPDYSEDKSKNWGCKACNNDFPNLESYKTHMSECTEHKQSSNRLKRPKARRRKKEFLCDICGIVIRHANFIIHKRIHDNVFPYKCEQCPYRGRNMELLKVHRRSHLAVKPFKCAQCPHAATSTSNLARHVRVRHSTARDFKCTYCEKAFSSQYNVKKHIRDIHLRQGTVQCDICFKEFNTKKILQGHRVKVHKIRSDRHGRLPAYLQCQLE